MVFLEFFVWVGDVVNVAYEVSIRVTPVDSGKNNVLSAARRYREVLFSTIGDAADNIEF